MSCSMRFECHVNAPYHSSQLRCAQLQTIQARLHGTEAELQSAHERTENLSRQLQTANSNIDIVQHEKQTLIQVILDLVQ